MTRREHERAKMKFNANGECDLRARDTFGLKVLPTLEILNELTDILRQRYSCQKRSAVLERTR